MTKGRLTRQELSWLLAQEAQNAAERLRSGVQGLRGGAGVPEDVKADETNPSLHVDASLDVLDDVMKMLSNLNQRPAPAPPPRRGRIDLAALVLEVAPDARVSIEPGSGTEVFGDELDFRRMVQILVGHASGDGSSATVRRDGDEVRIAVTLGPDTSPTADTERSWLSRMALRHGGRHELEGGTERLSFPADDENREREELLRELDHARRQGEVYARELAAAADRDESEPTISSMPPSMGAGFDRLSVVAKICGGLAEEMVSALASEGRRSEGGARGQGSEAGGSEESPSDLHALAERWRRIGALVAHELEVDVDLASATQTAAAEIGPRAERLGVSVLADTSRGIVYARAQVKVVDALVQELVAYAVARTPRGGSVRLAIETDRHGSRLVVDDGGPRLPKSARRATVGIERSVDGRSGASLAVASELATSQGAVLTLTDAPTGGLRASVFFPKGA